MPGSPSQSVRGKPFILISPSGKKILLGHKENLLKLLDDKEWMGVLNDCFLANRPVGAIDEGNQDGLTASEKKKSKTSQQSLSEKEKRKVGFRHYR